MSTINSLYPVIPCPDLTVDPPLNGAIACETWTHGLRCQLQCNSAFDVPRTAPTDGEYVCADTVGEWRPSDLVPDCSGGCVCWACNCTLDLLMPVTSIRFTIQDDMFDVLWLIFTSVCKVDANVFQWCAHLVLCDCHQSCSTSVATARQRQHRHRSDRTSSIHWSSPNTGAMCF